MEWADEPEVVYMCRHPSVGENPKEMGPVERGPGVDCALREEGAKKKAALDPAVERRLKAMLGDNS